MMDMEFASLNNAERFEKGLSFRPHGSRPIIQTRTKGCKLKACLTERAKTWITAFGRGVFAAILREHSVDLTGCPLLALLVFYEVMFGEMGGFLFLEVYWL